MLTIRHYHDLKSIDKCFTQQTCPFIKITKEGGIAYAQTSDDKIALLQSRENGDRFIVPRAGVLKTDVFELSDIDIAGIIEEYNK